MKINEIVVAEQIRTWQDMEQEIIQDITLKTGDRPAHLMKINTQKAAQDAFALYSQGKPQKDAISSALEAQGVTNKKIPKHKEEPGTTPIVQPPKIKKASNPEKAQRNKAPVKKSTRGTTDFDQMIKKVRKKGKELTDPVTIPFNRGRELANRLLQF